MFLTLIIVFLCVLLFSIIPNYLGTLTLVISSALMKKSKRTEQLEAEYKEIREEMRQINMADEFAKYAKKERQSNKLLEELKASRKERNDFSVRLNIGLKIVFHVVQVSCFLFLIYSFRSTPVINLPPEWFWPFADIISFPTWIPGGISVTIWLLTCRVVVRGFQQVFLSS